MRTPLARRNLLHRGRRSLAALAGVAFAIFLIFAQLGFRAATARGATLVFDALAYDLLILSPNYEFLTRPREVPREALARARAVEGVAEVVPLRLAFAEWRNPQTGLPWALLALGVDPATRPFRDASTNARLGRLAEPGAVLMDTRSRAEYGPRGIGAEAELQGERVRVVGRYTMGAGFVANATLVCSERTLARVLGDPIRRGSSLGLVRLEPGAEAVRAKAALAAALGPSAVVMTREEHSAREARLWLDVKPIGIVFTSGVAIAFLAGAVVLYQVLASEVQARLREYATLKALGFADREVYGVVLRQALLFSGLGFLPALLAAAGLYALVRARVALPVSLDWERVLFVAGLTAAMCLSAALLAVRRLRTADPADLF
ncbi:MAG: FtsX-like permease family protein [Vicinamibacteria bacterium]